MVDSCGPGDEYAIARRTKRVHANGGRCLNCTDAGCVAYMWALEVIAQVAAEQVQRRVDAILLNGVRPPEGQSG